MSGSCLLVLRILIFNQARRQSVDTLVVHASRPETAHDFDGEFPSTFPIRHVDELLHGNVALAFAQDYDETPFMGKEMLAR